MSYVHLHFRLKIPFLALPKKHVCVNSRNDLYLITTKDMIHTLLKYVQGFLFAEINKNIWPKFFSQFSSIFSQIGKDYSLRIKHHLISGTPKQPHRNTSIHWNFTKSWQKARQRKNKKRLLTKAVRRKLPRSHCSNGKRICLR